MDLRNTRDIGLAEGCSFGVAYREFRSRARNDEDLLPAIHGSKDPSTFAILFEDGAALAGLVIAFAGLLLAQILQKPFPDAIASIGIALILMIAAALLGNEARGLLVGEGARKSTVRKICELVEADSPSKPPAALSQCISARIRFYWHSTFASAEAFRREMLPTQLTASKEPSVAGFPEFATSTWRPMPSRLCFAPTRTPRRQSTKAAPANCICKSTNETRGTRQPCASSVS
jgi:hypothetical protein